MGREVLRLHRAWNILGCLQRRQNQWCPKAAFLLPPTSPARLQLVRSRNGRNRELGWLASWGGNARKESSFASILTSCPWKLRRRHALPSSSQSSSSCSFSRSWDRQGWGGGGRKPAPRGRSHQLGSPVGQGPSDTQGGPRLVGEKKHVPESAGVRRGWPILHLAFYLGGGMSLGINPHTAPRNTEKTCLSWCRTR